MSRKMGVGRKGGPDYQHSGLWSQEEVKKEGGKGGVGDRKGLSGLLRKYKAVFFPLLLLDSNKASPFE